MLIFGSCCIGRHFNRRMNPTVKTDETDDEDRTENLQMMYLHISFDAHSDTNHAAYNCLLQGASVRHLPPPAARVRGQTQCVRGH